MPNEWMHRSWKELGMCRWIDDWSACVFTPAKYVMLWLNLVLIFECQESSISCVKFIMLKGWGKSEGLLLLLAVTSSRRYFDNKKTFSENKLWMFFDFWLWSKYYFPFLIRNFFCYVLCSLEQIIPRVVFNIHHF
jgi:hypothetical protein